VSGDVPFGAGTMIGLSLPITKTDGAWNGIDAGRESQAVLSSERRSYGRA